MINNKQKQQQKRFVFVSYIDSKQNNQTKTHTKNILKKNNRPKKKEKKKRNLIKHC